MIGRPAPEFPERLRDALTTLNRNGAVSGADVAVTRALTDTTTPPEVVHAIVLVSMALRLGHSCIDLADAAGIRDLLRAAATDSSGPESDAAPVGPTLPEAGAWVRAVAESGLAESTSDGVARALDRPLVLDEAHRRLWFSRYAAYEQRLAAALLDRSHAPGVLGAAFEVETAVGSVFGSGLTADDPQRAAVFSALTRPVSFITGGPGTGKTWTIARLLETARVLGLEGPETVALAAPTGKAAERMTEAVGGDLTGTTLHRLLGIRPGVVGWDPDDPLPHRLVIVDEASMIDLPLMTRLVTSLRDDAHLVLVGDHNQLVSVEVGSVLRDVIEAAELDDSPLHETVTTLTIVHRQQEQSPILPLAEAIKDGEADRVIALLESGSAQLERVDPDSHDADVALDRAVTAAEAMITAARRSDARVAIAAAKTLRVLCATRRGTAGLTGWSNRIRRAVGFTEGDWVTGRPVIVTRNDAANGVFNGDTGITVSDPKGAGSVKVAFATGDDIRYLPSTSLRDVEDWWAMTIHKSQGSEYDHVVVALPEAASPILTRELLYTAVTRAKASVTIVAGEQTVRAAVSNPVARASGLRDRLGGQDRRDA